MWGSEQKATLPVHPGLLIVRSFYLFMCCHTPVNVIQDRVGVSVNLANTQETSK